MKKITGILIFVFLSNIIHAQTEGRIRYLVTHSWTKKMAALTWLSKQRKERMAYMWGADEWKVYTELFFNLNESKYADSEEKAEKSDEGYSWLKDTYIIKRNYKENKMTDAIQMLGKVYLVEGELPTYDWKIQNDLKDISGHICMKAVTEDTVKQQKIVAWFAQDMPVSAGPERYCGLPGLILELDVNDGAMVISADLIESKKLTAELDLPKKLKGKKITEAEYQTMIKKYYDEKTKAEEPPFWGIRY